jgi:hypothetical protein
MATDTYIGRWKFSGSPATVEVYCLGLRGIDFNLPLFKIGRKRHKVTFQCGASYIRVPIGHEYRSVVGKSGSFTFAALGQIGGEGVIQGRG